MSIKKKLEKSLKPCLWVGSSQKDLRAFPDRVKRDMGTALMYAQAGGKAENAKPFKGVGSGGVELVEDHDGDTYRCVYLLRLQGAVYVLHAFQKKSRTGIKTPQKDIDLVKSRIRLAEEDYRKKGSK